MNMAVCNCTALGFFFLFSLLNNGHTWLYFGNDGPCRYQTCLQLLFILHRHKQLLRHKIDDNIIKCLTFF
jgi:hypothetical protein